MVPHMHLAGSTGNTRQQVSHESPSHQKPCMFDGATFYTGPGHGSPRHSTGAEEVTPREARFHVFPFVGFHVFLLYAC